MKPSWSTLCEVAQTEIELTQAALPPELRVSARTVPVILENHPSAAILADGFTPDILGLFVGSPAGDPDPGPEPAQIILYLDNLWEAADGDESIFREEARITYLHELGHFLGLDEDDLDERGLL